MPSDDVFSLLLDAPPTILALLLGIAAVGVVGLALHVVLRAITKERGE
ncbi:hypothetical protein PVV74_22510 [Roseovarius sp. SK2]|nr:MULTISPECIES: hypothetical protein [unclassified Roseovarius]MDD9728224.1 hypothetical protein [Roseovarius sp. SK2]